jgi:alpha/beta superfamily hydrolase
VECAERRSNAASDATERPIGVRRVAYTAHARLAAAGITALAIDYRGFGESGGARFDTLSNEQKAAVTATAWPGDFDAALAFLSRQSGVDASRMGAAGGSCGVNNVIHLAQRHGNIKALALLAGPADREARTFIEAPGAPPVFTAAAADDRYADFVLVSSWQFGISSSTESRFAQYRDGGHAAVVFRTHPELADLIVQWFGAVLNNSPASLPSTNGVPLAPAVLEGLKAIETPGAAAAAAPLLPEYIVNWIGYEHIGLKDSSTALRIMKLNAASYPKSANAQDSLSDAYVAAGDAASALTAAKRTLELLDADTSMTPQQKNGIRGAAEAKIARLAKH